MLHPRPTEAQTGGTGPGVGIQQNLQVILKVLICLFLCDRVPGCLSVQMPWEVRKGLRFLEPELETVVSPYVVLGMQPRSSVRTLSSLTTDSSLQTLSE